MIVGRGAQRLILSLFEIAYRTRTCLPLILSAGFMLSEVQVRLEINVGARAEIQREGAQIAFEIEEVDDVEEAEEAREIAA